MKKTRQIKNLEPRFGSIETEKALDIGRRKVSRMEQMLRSIPAIARTVFTAFAVILLSAQSYAGEAFSERDELDNGPSFFGEAKEVRSLRSIQKVQVKAELGQRRISTYTNAEGHFKIPSFGKETVADNVTITCAKEGYRTLDISRRRMSAAADAPIEIECLLEPTP